MRKLYLILKNDLLLPSTFLLIITNIIFVIFLLIIFGFVIGGGRQNNHDLAIVSIWVSYLINLGLLMPKLFVEDFSSGRFEVFAAGKTNLRTYFIAKVLYTIVIFIMIDLISIPIAALLFSLDYNNLINIIISVLVTNPAIAMLTTIFALMMVQNNLGNNLSAIIVLPLLIPIIILAIMAASKMTFSLLILTGINLILLPLGVILSRLLLTN